MNPILQALDKSAPHDADNASMLMSMLSGNPQKAYDQLMRANPKFKQFVTENIGKTPQQIAEKYGLNINDVLNRLGAQRRK